MKPFNLERALAGDPVISRNGRKVRKLHVLPDEFKRDYSLIILFEDGGTIDLFPQGIASRTFVSPFDLFMGPVKQERWVAIHKQGDGYYLGGMFMSETACQEFSSLKTKVGIAKIEWEE